MNILLSSTVPSHLTEHGAGAPSHGARAPSPRKSGERERGRRAICTSLLALLAAFSFLSPSPTRAQTYPTRPVTIIVPFAAGGGNDVMARLLGARMGDTLGQNFVIENRPGAAGTTGTRAAAKAKPDGYTLLVGHSGVFGIAPSLYANPGYDPRKDFSPIGLIGSFQQVLVVNPSVPVHNVADLIAAAKREPGKITYASAGIGSGSHLSTELFTAMAGIKLIHVPFRGTGATLTDLIAGRVDMMITTMPSVISAVRSGQLRAVAVTGESRSPLFPDLPTFTEAGVPGYVAVIHYGMVAPARLDRAIGERLNASLNAALADPQIRARIADDGGEPRPGTRERQAADGVIVGSAIVRLVEQYGASAELLARVGDFIAGLKAPLRGGS